MAMETFADVLHNIIDVVFKGDTQSKAHDVIDRASGQRTIDDTDTTATAAAGDGGDTAKK